MVEIIEIIKHNGVEPDYTYCYNYTYTTDDGIIHGSSTKFYYFADDAKSVIEEMFDCKLEPLFSLLTKHYNAKVRYTLSMASLSFISREDAENALEFTEAYLVGGKLRGR